MNTNIEEIEKKLAPVDQRTSNEALSGIYSSGYWNDIEEEKKKEWWIADGDYKRCMNYLIRAGLMNEWAVVVDFVSELPGTDKLKVADLAAGIGWTSALFSKLDRIGEVHATEISYHRLAKLFPYAVDMFDANPEKIRRYIGSFYELGFKNESMDIVFMSQAFHHADQPLNLLNEINRITRGGG
jgi:ubiquinone/menaquinone biosynthesis C-methylase UbiE